MNFLNGACRHARATSWSTPCCRDVLKSTQIVNANRVKLPCAGRRLEWFQTKLCTGNLRIASGLSMWTQVRFQKECPRFHRDLEFPDFDPYRKDENKDVRKTHWGDGDKKHGFTYVVGFFGMLCSAYGLKSELVHFISFMDAAADVLAMASIEVDLGKIAPGGCLAYKWRGKPLFVKSRTQTEIDLEANTPLSSLRDPQTPEQRAIKQEWLIVIGICTHLGCVPIPNAGDWSGGFYCPCHGSHYDNVGRARKGPAPLNLEVPPYKFLSDTLVVVG